MRKTKHWVCWIWMLIKPCGEFSSAARTNLFLCVVSSAPQLSVSGRQSYIVLLSMSWIPKFAFLFSELCGSRPRRCHEAASKWRAPRRATREKVGWHWRTRKRILACEPTIRACWYVWLTNDQACYQTTLFQCTTNPTSVYTSIFIITRTHFWVSAWDYRALIPPSDSNTLKKRRLNFIPFHSSIATCSRDQPLKYIVAIKPYYYFLQPFTTAIEIYRQTFVSLQIVLKTNYHALNIPLV